MKSYDGCWTCRLRRKKCDEERPVCQSCSTLQITCSFADDKPPWMDGGTAQRQKAADVRREVKASAARRRGIEITDSQAEPEMDKEEVPSGPMGLSISSSPGWASFPQTVSQESSSKMESLFTDNCVPDQELDRRLVVFYMDHFFPFLFPFYRPSLLQGGRSWVMELIARNKAMWHTTLCLGSYFLSVALNNTASGHQFCKNISWDKLLRQTDVTFKMLQSQLQQVTFNHIQSPVVEKARIMGSVVQIQRFESSVGNFANCQTHLRAAIELFRQILSAAGNTTNGSGTEGELPFYGVLSQMGAPPWTMRNQQHRAWSSDQAAFRFFSALILVDDIINSTCLDEPPRLLEYHSHLLGSHGRRDSQPPVKLEEVVGCENWVMLQIGKIAALDAWKKSLRKAGQLDTMELVARALVIKQTLLDHLAQLDAATNPLEPTSSPDPFLLYSDQLLSTSSATSALVTRIWAHAALLYLSVVVSGWQASSPEVRENVLRTLGLLNQLPAPALLRTTVWPLCVVGCLSQTSEECLIRSMIEALVPTRLFGATQKALEIMETAWRWRDSIDIDRWDFAECVRSVGEAVLLV